MDFSKLASLSIGLAAFLGGLWIVLQIMRSLKRNGQQRTPTSGEQSIDYWKNAIRQAVKDGLEDEIKGRDENIRRIEREELDRKGR